MAINLPDHTTPEGAGPGQPIHVEQIGQSLFPDANAPGGIAVDSSSLHPGKYLLGLTLDRIYRLLSSMIESLQDTAVAQANRLQIFTDWQNAYNSKMASIHSFVASNKDAFVSATDEEGKSEFSNARSDLNNVNSSYTEQMKGNSNIIGNDAKQLQTILGQTQDNVNKAANMATSLIQQMQTILATIFP